jgi:hypothetical protein
MSLRAIRKIQERQQNPSVEDSQSDEDDGGDSQEETSPARPNIFALLGGNAEEDSEKEEEAEKENEESSETAQGARQFKETSKPATAKASSRKKKKKNKKKAKDTAGTVSAKQDAFAAKDSNLPDDIDKVLSSLAISSANNSDVAKRQEPAHAVKRQEHTHYNRALAVDTQRLIVENEMRQLFGRAALKADAEDPTDNTRAGRRRARDRRRQGLAGTVAGQHGLPGGVGLKGLMLQRRNLLARGKEEWPPFTSSGLSMEVEGLDDDGTLYRFVPNRFYVDVEEQYEMCRASGDPHRMLDLWQFNRACASSHGRRPMVENGFVR